MQSRPDWDTSRGIISELWLLLLSSIQKSNIPDFDKNKLQKIFDYSPFTRNTNINEISDITQKLKHIEMLISEEQYFAPKTVNSELDMMCRDIIEDSSLFLSPPILVLCK